MSQVRAVGQSVKATRSSFSVVFVSESISAAGIHGSSSRQPRTATSADTETLSEEEEGLWLFCPSFQDSSTIPKVLYLQ